MKKPIFSMNIHNNCVTVNELPTGSYEVVYEEFNMPTVTIHQYDLEAAMQLARTFIADDEVNYEV